MNGAHLCPECMNIGDWKSPKDPDSDKKFKCPKCGAEYTFNEFGELPYYSEKQLSQFSKEGKI